MLFRIGVNSGDIMEKQDGTVFGDGVNLAARFEGLADPGGILISHVVREAIADTLDAPFVDNGERKFKNVARPIRVWSWPHRLSANRQDRKPLVFVAGFAGRSEAERRLAGDLDDELKAQLSRLTGLEIAVERHSAHYVVEGTVRQAARRCRVFARLIDIEGDKQIWSERYDEDTDDPFDILDHCVHRMAMSVRRRIATDDAQRLADRNLDELSLEELLSAAGVSFFTPTKAGWKGGGEIAERVLELDRDNFMALAMAAAGLGLAEFLYGFRRPEGAVIERAFRRIEDGARLTNRSDMLFAAHALLHLYARRRHDQATTATARSLALNPDFNMGLWALGATKVFSGDFEAGVEAATRAANIDIRDPYVHHYSRIAGYGHFGLARYRDAADWFGKADQLAPGLAPNLIALVASRWLADDRDGARDALARLLAEEPAFRISDIEPLPFRDPALWEPYPQALRDAGAPA